MTEKTKRKVKINVIDILIILLAMLALLVSALVS